MSEVCENRNPLMRDGTSQQQRLIKALLPDYVKVDERSFEELGEFVSQYAQLIWYYNFEDGQDGDWNEMMQNQVDANGNTKPHFALFVAFLQLFKFAQDDVNTITRRHLDFYYKEVLRIEEKPAVPDQVYIIFQLAQQVAGHLVAKGTALKAGKDATGVDLVYDTENDIVVNTAQAVEFKALFNNLNNDGRLYASPVANSEDGLGKEIESEEPRWRTFGTIADPLAPFNSPLADRPQAQVGFAIASPSLLLGEGNRVVTITLTVSNLLGLTTNDVKNAFKVYFSGAEGWIEPEASTSKVPQDATYVTPSSIVIQRTLTEAQDAIVPYNPEVLLEPFATQWPVAKIVLNTANPATPYVYQAMKDLVITNATIALDIDNVKNIVVQNDSSTLDASKPFQPFGNQPLLTSSFYIGSREVFSKRLTSLGINITWKGLPAGTGGFGTYYNGYIPAKSRNNGDFRAAISMLDGRAWKPLVAGTDTQARLFDTAGPGQTLSSFRGITVANSALNNIPADPQLPEIEEWENSTEKGFVRLTLSNVDFGHSDYQISFTTAAINAAKNEGSFTLPNEPYTPLISELSLSYTASVSISLLNNASTNNAAAFAARKEQFFHVQPFGVAEMHPFIVKTAGTISLLPVYNDEGALYIGLNALTVPRNLSILFKVAEGSADPDLPKQTVDWSYMVNNEWITFPKENVINDFTNGLITSGIITFTIPKNATSNNTALTPGLHWIRASVTNNARAICDMIDIRTQAVNAVFADNGNDPQHLAVSLPANTIKGLVDGQSQIAKVLQPYASFGGKMKETGEAYYIRVSERLRHKNRAIMIWDYERMVLEAFPGIYKVKCLNHTRYISTSDIKEISPGHVSLVIVSNLQNKNAVNPLKPKTSLYMLTQIHDLIKKLNPPCAELFVKNPIFEEIVVHFNVRFLPGFDPGFYLNQLNNDIIRFLAPWAYGSTDISFGESIHASVIINFIEEREYVDYISCFRMDQVTATGTLFGVEEAVPSTSASIVTSAPSHFITVLETDDCECNDNIVDDPEATEDACPCDEEKEREPVKFGIGTMVVGDNFIVGNGQPLGNDGIGNMQIGNDFEVH